MPPCPDADGLLSPSAHFHQRACSVEGRRRHSSLCQHPCPPRQAQGARAPVEGLDREPKQRASLDGSLKRRVPSAALCYKACASVPTRRKFLPNFFTVAFFSLFSLVPFSVARVRGPPCFPPNPHPSPPHPSAHTHTGWRGGVSFGSNGHGNGSGFG